MKKKAIFLLLFLMLYVSCKNDNKQMYSLKRDFIEAIENYVRNDTNYDKHYSYFIIPSDCLYTTAIVPKGFLIGPYYEDLLGKKKLEIVKIMEVNSKDIFVDVSKMPFNNTIDIESIQYCDEDSIMLCTVEGIPLYYSYEKVINYIKRAHLLYYVDSHLIVNERADTFYLPKLIKSQTLPNQAKSDQELSKIED